MNSVFLEPGFGNDRGLPLEFGSLTNLVALDLSYSLFMGPFTATVIFKDLTKLENVLLSGLNLSNATTIFGILPSLPNLTDLCLSDIFFESALSLIARIILDDILCATRKSASAFLHDFCIRSQSQFHVEQEILSGSLLPSLSCRPGVTTTTAPTKFLYGTTGVTGTASPFSKSWLVKDDESDS